MRDGRGHAPPESAAPRNVLADVINFWGETFPVIPEKTRGNIVITLIAVLTRFLHGRLARAFCGRLPSCRI